MDKETLLAVNFNRAPAELQAAATAHAASVKALQKLKAQILKTESEIQQAEIKHGETEKSLRRALNAWTPEP